MSQAAVMLPSLPEKTRSQVTLIPTPPTPTTGPERPTPRSDPSPAPAPRQAPASFYAGLFVAPPQLARYRHPGLTVFDIPPTSDPRWWGWTRELAAFLDRPRTWAELTAWSSLVRLKGELLRHMLAALEEMDDAGTSGADEELVWRHYPVKVRSRRARTADRSAVG